LPPFQVVTTCSVAIGYQSFGGSYCLHLQVVTTCSVATVYHSFGGLKREEVVGGWRRLHNEELDNLHASANIIKVIKSRRMRWGGSCSTH